MIWFPLFYGMGKKTIINQNSIIKKEGLPVEVRKRK